MPHGVIKGVGISGVACAVPDRIVKSEEYYDRFGKECVDKFINMTGIHQRHLALGRQCVSDLCYTAARRLMEHLKWEPESIGALIMITSTPDYKLPSTACVLQHRLGLGRDCAAFDVNLGCSAYPYGIWLLSSLMSNSGINRALLLVGNQNNINIDPDDRSTAMLFGDAGSATALENKEDSSIKYSLNTDGKGFRHIIVNAGSARNRNCSRDAYLHSDGSVRSDYNYYMNGTAVFNFTISQIPAAVEGLMRESGIGDDDVDLYIMHQANQFILDRFAAKLKIPANKMPVSIGKFGNTSGASLPLTLVDKAPFAEWDNLRLILCGFGVGLSWGTVYLSLSRSACLPLIYSNDYFEEGEVRNA